MDGLRHLGILYYTVCYSTGLPSLTVAILALMKTRSATAKRFLPLLAAVTAQLALSTILQYREANLAPYLTGAHVLLLHLYFAAESATIFALPYLAHHLAEMPRSRKWNAIFGAAALVSCTLVFSPFLLRFDPWEGRVQSLSGFYIYRTLLFATILYGLFVVVRARKRIAARRLGLLVGLALAFFLCWLAQLLQCRLLPDLHLPLLHIPLAPACYLVWNAVFLATMARRHFQAPNEAATQMDAFCAQYRITKREREIIEQLLAGRTNSEIQLALHISESTVKTHILNIYRKLGVKNRVQLANLVRCTG
ncbi:MAG: helix-turn-helix domain-containing protein [Bacteroidota bacterium]